MNDSKLLKPSEIAEIAKILPSKVRHYTELGLLRAAAFTDGGFKLYDKNETLERLKRISALSEKGMTLDEIKLEMNRPVTQRRILLVEDDRSVIDFYEIVFPNKFPGWEIRFAADGFAAGRILSQWVPDLVILDLMMPGMNGFDVCRDIRKDPTLADVKIIGVTGFYSQEFKDKILQAGANDFLTKPLELDKLYGKIGDLLGLDKSAAGDVQK